MNKFCIVLSILTVAFGFYLIEAEILWPIGRSVRACQVCERNKRTEGVGCPTPRALEVVVERQNTPSLPAPVWTKMVCNVSAYCPCEKCCGEYADGITASGQDVNGPVRHWIAAPARYPFGTAFRIPGYNSGRPVVVLDRGGAIKGNKLDLYFPTHAEALEWGRRIITVEVSKG